MNKIRDAVITSLGPSEGGDLEGTIPPLDFEIPKKGSDAVHTVAPAEARRLYMQLESFLAPQNVTSIQIPTKPLTPQGGRKVFIVHGHDEAAREAVARFVERLGFEPVILHEQASSGSTVIEKLERYSDVCFAIVLLTPDDEGRKIGTDQLRRRARQNVVLELGYFIGRLRRTAVCALYKGNVEIPSDYLGVLFEHLDDAGGWRLRLAREMRGAGLDVDLNKAM